MGGFVYFANVLDLLKQPYPLNESRANRVRRNLLFGLFVTLVLLIFRPFDVDTLPHFELHTLGYGLVTSASMFLLNALLMAVFPRFFTETAWTTGKEIMVTMLNIAFIGLANALYTTWAVGGGWSIHRLVYFEVVTVGVGIFPIAASFVANQMLLEQKYRSGALVLNADLAAVAESPHQLSSGVLHIKGVNQDESLEIPWQSLLLVQAAENYIELVYETHGKINNKVFRKSMKQLEADLSDFPALFRCHKSFVVNLQRVVRTSGNAQGYRLHLDAGPLEVPVSRALNAALPTLLHQHARHVGQV